MINPYTILGLQKGASMMEIKQAYRKLAFKFHPDHNKTPDAEIQYARIKSAYEELSDPEKRLSAEGKGGYTANPLALAEEIWKTFF